MKNDFMQRLQKTINAIPELGMHMRMDYLQEQNDLVIYALPGGNTLQTWMDGSKQVEVLYELAVKTKDQQVANDVMWSINEALNDDELQIPSANESYEFEELKVGTPALNDRDEDGWYIYFLDVTATIII